MKSVLITGCSDGGIGSALALAFAQRGLLVFASARNITKMSGLANMPNVRLLTLDITKPEEVRAALAAVKKETGGSLDYLINNAAQARYMPLLDEDPNFEQAKELFELNVWSQLRMVQAFAPLLIEAKGTVVYISAVSARLNFPWIGMYSASKRCTEILFDALRHELAPFGVTSTTVVTGPVKSVIHSHGDSWQMPENSRYADIKETIERRGGGEDGAWRMDAMKFAEGVVDKLLKGKNIKIWAGASVGLINFLANWLPDSWQDFMYVKGTGVDVMVKNSNNKN